MEHGKVVAIDRLIAEEYRNIVGVIVRKDNETVLENYYNGWKQNEAIHIASVTKSIFSLLIGIAIDKGAIQGTDQPILDFFQDYQPKRGEKTIRKIKIRDVLTMTAPYKFRYEPYTKVYSSDDWTKSVLDLAGGKGRIGAFKYTTIGLQILSGVLMAATGRSVTDFAAENLFSHLHIAPPENVTINDKTEYLAFLKNKQVNAWVVDPQGANTAGWGLALSPRDMAKIGQLCLNRGQWNGKQIVASEWIECSTVEHSRMGNLPYGYLWWVINKNYRNDFAALGDSGNVIFVAPQQHLVIAIASQFMPRTKDRIELIEKNILPLFDIH